MNIQVYFFDLIKIAIGQKSCLAGIPEANEWQELYHLAKKQTLIGVIFSAIEKLPKEQRPPKLLLMKWFADSETIKERNLQANEDAVKICKETRKDGFPCLVLKGQGIATYYPEPSLRTPGDIDLWIKGDYQSILTYLRLKGKVKGTTYMHADYEGTVVTEVEVHYKPSFFHNPFYHCRLNKYLAQQNDLFDNYVELPENKGQLFIPSVEFNRFYILQHIYRHYFGEGVGLRQLLDYYYVLLKGGTEESKQRTIKLFKQTGMMKFLAATMWVLQEVFGLDNQYLLCKPHENAGKQLLNEIMLAGNFGKYDTRIDRKNHHKLLPRVLGSIKRKVRFVIDYPQEILFDIPMRTYMYIWKYFM